MIRLLCRLFGHRPPQGYDPNWWIWGYECQRCHDVVRGRR